jgi:hypothetical protein
MTTPHKQRADAAEAALDYLIAISQRTFTGAPIPVPPPGMAFLIRPPRGNEAGPVVGVIVDHRGVEAMTVAEAGNYEEWVALAERMFFPPERIIDGRATR